MPLWAGSFPLILYTFTPVISAHTCFQGLLMGLTFYGGTHTRISLVMHGYIPEAEGLSLNKTTLHYYYYYYY
jgi:hypothetical protein